MSDVPPMLKVIMLVAVVLVLFGLSLELRAWSVEMAFHAMQTEYIVEFTKAQRDTAEAGSELAQMQAKLKNTPSQLMLLKLGGIASILAGISLILLGVLRALTMVPTRLGAIIKS